MYKLTKRPGRSSKGGLERAVSWISAAHPDASVEVWCQDEARLGLMPVVRRVWAPYPIISMWYTERLNMKPTTWI